MEALAIGFLAVALNGLSPAVTTPGVPEINHNAEITCIDKGHTWPVPLVNEKKARLQAAQLQASEFALCIEREVNVLLKKELDEQMETNNRLMEIEIELKALFKERQLMKEKSVDR